MKSALHHSEQYDDLLREAHRRGAPPVGAPALIWHMALWPTPYPKVYSERIDRSGARFYACKIEDGRQDKQNRTFLSSHGLVSRYNERRWDWIGMIDDYVDEFVKRLMACKTGPWAAVTEPDLSHNNRFLSETLEEAFAARAQMIPPDDSTWWQRATGSPIDLKAASLEDYARRREELSLPAPRTQDCRYLNFRWHGWLVKSTFILHTEFITVTFSIDLSKQPKMIDSETELTEALTKLQALLPPLDKAAASNSASPTESGAAPLAATAAHHDPSSPFKGLAEELMTGVWKRFASELLPQEHRFYVPFNRRLGEHKPLRYEVGTQLFADFRGIVLVAGKEGQYGIFGGDEPEEDEDFEDKPTFGKSETDNKKALVALKRLWPFVQACHGGASLASKFEFVGCKILDGRALYVSALGRNDETDDVAAAPAGPADETKAVSQSAWDALRLCYLRTDEFHAMGKIKYLLVLNGLDPASRTPAANAKPVYDRWQIGRLVHRINLLGTLRLAAIRDLKELRKAGTMTVILGQHLSDLYQQTYEAPRKAGRELIDFFKHLARVGENIPYGIEHRINRSRVYKNAFEHILKDMRVVPIEGWQPYSAFVRRRLYSVFDSVSLLGMRMLNLRTRANTLLDVVHTRTLLRYQRLADFIVIPAVTYYLGTMVIHVLGEPVLTLAFADAHQRGNAAGWVNAAIYLATLIFVAWFTHRIRTKDDD